MTAAAEGPQDATAVTLALNRAVLDALPFHDTRDFDDARRGFLATLPEIEIKNAEGRVVWSLRDYAFLDDGEAPPTVNPSLWRQARLNMHHGLFQITESIYQIRGFDLSNMTILEGERGIVVIDPLISTETARAGLDLYLQHRGRRPVTAVIYTHSHVDHYGGVRGVIDEADVQAGRVDVFAPDGFMEEVVRETVLAGTPMVRRAQFQFGPTLPKGPRGQVDAGLGKVVSRGTVTLIPPTRVIVHDRGSPHRRAGDRLPAGAGDRGARRDAHVLSRPEGAEPGRERHPQPAQHLPDPRRPGARRQRVGQVPQRGARSIRPRQRRGLRPAPLAGVGPRARARLPRPPARSLQVPARSDRAPHEPRLQGGGDRGASDVAAKPAHDMARARLLRHAQSQRQVGVPALPRLVRRQPGQPQSAPARRARPEVPRVHGRRGRRARARPR